MEPYNVSNLTEPPLKDQVGSGVLGFCFLLGIPGNILVVVMILRHFKRENFTLHLMLNLAASDILCLLNTPLAIYNLLWGWSIGDALCKTFYFFIYLSVAVSLLTITLISVHRYVFVLHPEQWARLGRKGEKALLFILWATACLPCGLLTSTYGVVRHGSRDVCWRIHMSDQRRVAILLSEFVMNFIFPFSIITTSYCRLHKKVNQTAFFSDQRLARLIMSIVVTFLILWTPCHVVSLLEVFAFSVKSHNLVLYNKLQAIKRVSRPIVKSFINSCVNPLLYAFNVRSLRGSG
ncbi:hypothetical protein ACEWY4_016047 [Coilia grayii]|uniref:G-protein coupled receptors family 1 profile domain-containing protein n=1 Tax=Coilia grayii TaxID=363190 RepID=A0ABD1JQR6_9TELE